MIPFNTQGAEERLQHYFDLPEEAVKYLEKLMSKALHFCSTVSWSMEVITPLYAQEILDTCGGNQRHVRPSGVKKIVAFQEMDRWNPFNGDSIKFNVGLKLVDGQHRLQAVIETGVPMVFLVIRGLPDNAEMTIDQGIRRSPGDIGKLGGIEKHQTSVMAAARIVDNYLTGKALSEHMSVSPDMLRDFVRHKWPELVDSAEFVHGNKLARLPRVAITIAAHYLIGLRDIPLRDAFFDDFVNVKGSAAENTAWFLREKLTFLAGSNTYNRKFSQSVFSYWVGCWESWVKGKKRKALPRLPANVAYLRFSHLAEVTLAHPRRW